MLFQDFEDRIRQVCLGAKFNVLPGIFGNVVEEFVQVLGQFCRRETVVLGMVFLLEYEAIEAWSQDLNGWLVKLLGENLWVQVVFILNKT